jgi:hypothetical protein
MQGLILLYILGFTFLGKFMGYISSEFSCMYFPLHGILMLASTQIILKKQIMLSLFASTFNADLLRHN